MTSYTKYHPKRLARLPGTGQVSIPGREGPCVRDLGATGSESPGVTTIQMGMATENPGLYAHEQGNTMGVAKMPPIPSKAGKDTMLKIRTAQLPPLPFKAGGWGGEMAVVGVERWRGRDT